jgi:hypothetical protein
MPRQHSRAAAGYEPLPENAAPGQRLGCPPTGAAHTAVHIPSDREHAISQQLLSFSAAEAHQVFQHLQTGSEGLSAGEVARRLRHFGPNSLATTHGAAWYR